MKANFGLGIATGTEGLMYPAPYSSARETVELAVLAEKLGFDSVWGNDHITTQHYVRDAFEQVPRYYAPLMILTAVAERTTKLKLGTALMVLPFRNPLVMAKEVATLDQLSDGRLLLGVGLGAYREEFEAEFGAAAAEMKRGKMLDESMTVMHSLFNQETVTFTGEYFDIRDAQSSPKPVQKPFAFYLGGNSEHSYRRIAQWGTGWLPALLTPAEVKESTVKLEEALGAVGRSISEIDIAPQISVCIAKTHEEAVERFEKSQLYRHTCSLGKSTMRGRDATNYLERNLVGSVEEVCAQVERYIEAGVDTFSALLFADNTLEETKEHIQFFSEEIISRYSK